MTLNKILNLTHVSNSDNISAVHKLPDESTNGLIFLVDGTGEFSVRFETSYNGQDWYAINELDAFSVSSMQSLSSSINIFSYVRAKIDIGAGGGSVDKLSIFY